VGALQKTAGTILADKPTPVSPFKLPAHITKFVMAQITLEVDALGPRTTDVSHDSGW